jgi:hypothetical protein
MMVINRVMVADGGDEGFNIQVENMLKVCGLVGSW